MNTTTKTMTKASIGIAIQVARMRAAGGARWGLIAMVAMVTAAGWASAVGRTPPAEDALLRMHDDFVLAFVQSEGFGRARVTPMMRLMHDYRTRGETKLWVQDLQLIGIARHDPPVVFSSAFQGFQHAEEGMALAPRREGRPLTDEERADVRALESGQRLVVSAQGDALRATAPIHAGGECLGCHKDKRAGDLLGAFVYTLRPLPEEPPAR